MKRLSLLLLALTLISLGGWATNTTVSTLAQLQTALAETADTIIVANTITLTNGTNLDGRNKVVQVPSPYMNDEGMVNASYSKFRVFTIGSGSIVSISNMTIIGGGMANTADSANDTGGIMVNGGILTMTNCNIIHCQRGLSNVSGKVILKDCSLVRNEANYGAGVLNKNADASIVMDGCSFSENRIAPGSGGAGAAAENDQGKMYMNNTIMANNYGLIGAINNKPGTSALYFMNCTISGNVSNNNTYNYNIRSAGAGVWAVNSIIADNKHISGGTGTPVEKEIGAPSGETSNTYFYYCVMGAIGERATYEGCISAGTVGENVFTDYVPHGLYTGSRYTTEFSHTALVRNGKKFSTPVLNSASGGKAATGGVKTYLDYSLSGSTLTVNMSYDKNGTNTALGNLTVASTDKLVNTYIDQTTRVEGVIGSSPTSDADYHTVYLGDVANGEVVGATVYGDTYKDGTEVTITAVPKDLYHLDHWTVKDMLNNTVTTSTEATLTFALTSRVEVTPTFDNKFVLTANQDLQHPTDYYTTFYSSDYNYEADSNCEVYYLTETGTVNEAPVFMLAQAANRIALKGTGIIIRSSQSNVTMTATNSGASYTADQCLMIGVDAATTYEALTGQNAGTYYILSYTNKYGVGFYQWESNIANIPAHKAYYYVSSSGARPARFGFNFGDGESTGISSSHAAEQTETRDAYNLSGQRVGKNYRGIVIINGRKVLRQ